MGLGNILILSQATVYVILFILAFFIFIPLSVNQAYFDGHCLLFCEGEWNHTALHLTITKWGASGLCGFPIFVGAGSVPMTLIFVVMMSIYLYKDTEPSWVGAFLNLLCCAACSGFLLVSGIFLSAGLKSWCNLVEEEYDSCSLSEVVKFNMEPKVTTEGFYSQITIAQFGVWASWICWLYLGGCSSYQLYMYHRNEDFFSSMARERQRLIQRVRSNPEMI